MMYYVNCSCVPPEAGGPICHSANCEFRQLPMTCVDSNSSASSDPNRQHQEQQQQQLITVVSHPGPLVPISMTTPSLQASEVVPSGARIIFQAPSMPCGGSARRPVADAFEPVDPRGEYFEQSISTEERNPGYTKPIADWNESHVRVLLSLYEKDRAKFLTKGLIGKKLWEEIAVKFNKETGLQLKGYHCENKWKVLMRGYRRAERDFEKSDMTDDQFRRTHPLFDRMKSILSQDPTAEVAVSAKDVETLSRESRMVWRPEDTRRLLHHYGNFRKRQKGSNLTLASWDEIARLIRQEIPTFTMNGSHCYSRFRLLRIKYQRAMLLCKDEAARWAHCPLFSELHAVLWEDPLPATAPLTPSQISKRKKEGHGNEANRSAKSRDLGGGGGDDDDDDDVDVDDAGFPSVIQLEASRQPQEEFTAYLGKLVDNLAASLKDRAMQDILGYVFNFRKKVRLSKNATPALAASTAPS